MADDSALAHWIFEITGTSAFSFYVDMPVCLTSGRQVLWTAADFVPPIQRVVRTYWRSPSDNKSYVFGMFLR